MMKSDEKALFEKKSAGKALFEKKSDEKALSSDEELKSFGRRLLFPAQVGHARFSRLFFF